MSDDKPIVTLKTVPIPEEQDEDYKKMEIHAVWSNGNEIFGYGNTLIEAIADALDSLEKAMLCAMDENLEEADN